MYATIFIAVASLQLTVVAQSAHPFESRTACEAHLQKMLSDLGADPMFKIVRTGCERSKIASAEPRSRRTRRRR